MSHALRFSHIEFMPGDFPFKIDVSRSFVSGKPGPLHSHDYFQLCYVMKGTCLHGVNGQQTTMVKGDFFSMPPYLEHFIAPVKGQENVLVLIDFMPSLIEAHMHDLETVESIIDFAYIQPLVAVNNQLLPKLNLSVSGQMIVERLISDMENEMTAARDGYRLAVKADLLKLLVIVGREYKQYLIGRHDEQIVAKYRDTFYQLFRFMESHFHENLNLDVMADKAHMSPTYFSAMFKMVKGQTFIEYLNEIRIHKAMDLLLHSGKSVTEISLAVGFNHLGHFNRMFKKIVGTTPTYYRKEAFCKKCET
ncbi:MAG: hypothetical protein K0Q59_881 [Paenibacillus sp.]|jgi:AraC-like DNA-binding protein|nr:hypothetical protein [Paenibacillus sp.]